MTQPLDLKLRAQTGSGQLNAWEPSLDPTSGTCANALPSTITVADGTRILPDASKESWLLSMAGEIPLGLIAGDLVQCLGNAGTLELEAPSPVTVPLPTGASCIIQIGGNGAWKFRRTDEGATVLRIQRPAPSAAAVMGGGCQQPPNCPDN